MLRAPPHPNSKSPHGVEEPKVEKGKAERTKKAYKERKRAREIEGKG